MNRKDKNKRAWPEGLYEQNGYFKFRRVDGSFKGLGKNQQNALKAARQYNKIYRSKDLIDVISSPAGNREDITKTSLKRFIDLFIDEILVSMEWGRSHTKNQLILLNKIKNARFATKLFGQISIHDISNFLSEFKPRMQNRYRALLVLLYKHAMDRGFVEANIAERKLKVKEGKKKRRRMSLKEYKLIYKKAPYWLKNAMDLSLQTTQGRNEVVNMKFSQVKDDFLYLTRQKVKEHEHANIKIPVEGKLKEVIERCNDNLESPFMIHKPLEMKQKKFLTKREHWTQVTPNQITKEFRKIVKSMDEFKNLPEDQTAPTFHEIRSLSIYLFEKQGYDAQKRATHRTRKMTEHYKKGHEVDYLEIEHAEIIISENKS